MSLRAFHIFFIVTALGLLAFLGLWSWHKSIPLALAALLGLACGIPYLIWFVHRGGLKFP